MMKKLSLVMCAVVMAVAATGTQAQALATCEDVVWNISSVLHKRQQPTIHDVPALVRLIRRLNDSKGLSNAYLSRAKAKRLGWSGDNMVFLWENRRGGTYNKLIGGDVVRVRGLSGNAVWRSADIDVLGGYRGVKRLVYSDDNPAKYISTDKLRSLVRIPACR